MKKVYTLIVIAACTLLTLTARQASAQTAAAAAEPQAEEQTDIETAVDKIDNRLSTLEKVLSKLPKISGFIQLLYTYEDSKPTTSQFRVRRARVTLAGDIYKKYADYNFMVEFAGSVKLIDAYIRLTPWKELNLQVGSFRPAFTLENVNYGATLMELIDYPQIVSKMTTLGEITGIGSGAAGRDIGLQLYGGAFNKRGFSSLQYWAGIYNGAGLDFNGINSHKDFAGMLRVNPIKNLAIVASTYWGKWAVGGEGTYADRNRWSGGFMYDDKKWFARGEYIGGVTEGLKSTNLLVAPANGRLHTDGAYLTAGVWFCDHKVAPVVRAEYYSQNTLHRKETTDIYYTVGVDYRPWKYLRFQVNYTAQTHTYDKPMGNQVLVMLTGMF